MSKRFTAVQFEAQYGDLVRREYAEKSTPYTLRRALEGRCPPVRVSEYMLKVWFATQASPPGTVTVSSAAELDEQYGDVVRAFAITHASAYKLCRALLTATPPLRITDYLAKQWLRRYGQLQYINSAGHLEMHCGDRIREKQTTDGMDAVGLRLWLREYAGVLRLWLREDAAVDVSEVTCRTWLSTDWSSCGKLLSIAEVEREVGARLRLPVYAASFSAAGADALAVSLLEGQPSVEVSSMLLRQWYERYHPARGPLQIQSVEELEVAVGYDLRNAYAGMGPWALCAALRRRTKAILVDRTVVLQWQRRYPSEPTVRRRPASRVLKRPASVLSKGTERSTERRRAASVGAGSVSEASASATLV